MDLRIFHLYQRLTSGEDMHPLVAPVRAPVRWGLVFYRQLRRDQAFVRAAGMAYITLIALVPGLLLVFGVLGATGLLESNADELETLIFGTFLGNIPEVREVLWPGLMRVDLATLGLVGTLGLIFVVARLFLIVERSYSDIFGVPVERSLATRLLNFYFTLTAVPIATLGVVVGAAAVAADFGLGWLPSFLTPVLPFGVLFAALKLFPATRVRWRPALLGAGVSWILLEGGARAFTLYIRFFASDDPLHVIYGSMGLIPVFLLWLYLLWIFVLLGVEVAYVSQNYGSLVQAELDQLDQDRNPLRLPSVQVALELVLWVALRFESGAGPLPQDELARRAGLREREVRQILSLLDRRGLVARSSDGWLLTRPADQIALADVATAWRESTAVHAEDGVARSVAMLMEAPLEGTLADGLARWEAELRFE